MSQKQLWIFGMIDTQSKNFRLFPIFIRGEALLKKIIEENVKRCNLIISDAWAGYNWISSPNSGYVYIVHNHGHGLFRYGDESTSHIKNL